MLKLFVIFGVVVFVFVVVGGDVCVCVVNFAIHILLYVIVNVVVFYVTVITDVVVHRLL